VGQRDQDAVRLFSPRILVQLIGFGLFIRVKRVIRLYPLGIGLHLLADGLNRLAAHTHFIRQDLRLFAFDHAPYQSHDLFRLQAAAFKNRATIHVVCLIALPTAIGGNLTTPGNAELPRFLQNGTTVRTHHPAWVEIVDQPLITILARH
jgi:hypothetical protein